MYVIIYIKNVAKLGNIFEFTVVLITVDFKVNVTIKINQHTLVVDKEDYFDQAAKMTLVHVQVDVGGVLIEHENVGVK